MTLSERVGQLFMIGFEGTELSPEFIGWLKQFRPGGIIVFSRNLVDPLQIARLTQSLQEHSPNAPLLMAIDQEGGRVSRLPRGFTIFPPAAVVGACNLVDVAYEAAAVTAKELRAVGINMNMAPVLDVNTNLANPIIGDRAFGETPAQVCEMSARVIAGLEEHGVIACGKHFPGHGETTADSHLELPIVDLPKERLEKVELLPFRHAIKQGLGALMTAHVIYPALDEANPATLSRPILTDLLRNTLGFQGVILTDDLEMNAIIDHCPIGEAAVRSLQAGADMLVVCHRQDRQAEAMDAVRQAIKDGTIPRETIESSLSRITSLKKRFLEPYTPPDPQKVCEIVEALSHRQVLEKIQSAAKSF